MDGLGAALQGIVVRLASKQAPRVVRGLDADAVWHMLPEVPVAERSRLMRVAGWLWRTGVKDTAAICWLLRAGRESGARSLYAWYAPGGKARLAELERFQRLSAAREREGTEQWLSSGAR